MSLVPEETDEEEVASQFVGQLYDLFVEHRGLVMTLWASDSMSEEELAEAGIADINRALAVLGRIGAEGMDIRGMRSSRPDLVARLDGGDDRRAWPRSVRRSSVPSGRPRKAIVEELTQAILHGFLHRDR